MRDLSYIAAGLILATVTAAFGIATKARSEQATVFIVYAVSQHANSVQHITTAKYEADTINDAMRTCEHDVPLILEGYRRQNFTVLMPPQCGVGKPWSWIE